MTIRLIIPVMLFVLVCISGSSQDSNAVNAQSRHSLRTKSQQQKARYACPMHPEVTSAKRGKCPKCGMTLRLVKDKVTVPPTVNNDPAPLPGSSFSPLRIPDVRVQDQHGNQLNFYRDLVKNKTVAINFIFTTCTAICPVLTATFRRVQQEAVDRNLEVQLISVSVDPTTDTPARLHEFAAKFKAGSGWTFVTGNTREIDSLLRAMGVAVANKNDHTPMILIGNDKAGYWTRAYGASSPKLLVNAIAEASNK